MGWLWKVLIGWSGQGRRKSKGDINRRTVHAGKRNELFCSRVFFGMKLSDIMLRMEKYQLGCQCGVCEATLRERDIRYPFNAT